MTRNEVIAMQQEKIDELKQQIEKMKCCYMCKHVDCGHCRYEGMFIEYEDMEICDKWELTE